MGARLRDDPPSNWAAADPVDGCDDVFTSVDPDIPDHPMVWHWCTDADRWSRAGTRDHTVTQRRPLTLAPSLLWPCCGKHGWIREGRWVQA